jgi:hypothetical protein
MRLVAAAEATVFAQLQPLARLLLVLGRAVIPALTLGARQGDDVSHGKKPCQCLMANDECRCLAFVIRQSTLIQ